MHHLDGSGRDLSAEIDRSLGVVEKLLARREAASPGKPSVRAVEAIERRTEKALRARSSADGKYLTVALGTEEYGLPVSAVREIVGPLPGDEEHFRTLGQDARRIGSVGRLRRFGINASRFHAGSLS